MVKEKVIRFMEFLKDADPFILDIMGGWRGPDADYPALKELLTARLRYWLVGEKKIGVAIRAYPTDAQLIREAAREAWRWKERDPDALAHYCVHTASALAGAVMNKSMAIRREGYALLSLAAWMAIRTVRLNEEEFVETAVQRYRQALRLAELGEPL